MQTRRHTARKVLAILAAPLLLAFAVFVAPYSFGLSSPFDLCGMINAGSRATSLSFICRGVFYEDGIPSGIWQSKLPLLGQIDGCSPYFSLEPQAMNYLIDDRPLTSVFLAYDYAPNTSEHHMNQVLDKLLEQCGLTGETDRTVDNDSKLKRTELRRIGIIDNRGRAAYWQAWATRDKSEFGHTTYSVTVYTKDGIKNNVDEFASSALGIPKTEKSVQPDEFL